MLEIRAELDFDYKEISHVITVAFGQRAEAALVENLRKTEHFIPALSLVAIKDRQVVGHILFSKITIKTEDKTIPALALAPMAVRPEYQGQGIGTELMRYGIEECMRLKHKIIVVVGHPEYYMRFGFTPARRRGLEVPFDVPDDAFMVLELYAGTLKGVKGMVVYPKEFDEV
jgi:putative acetyltransferase